MNVFLKWWAKSVGIIGAPFGFLSSYAFTLMIIAFLQNTQPPVLPCLQEKLLIRHTESHPFFRGILFFSFAATKTISNQLSIKDLKGNYTPAFKALLKDYYLHL